MPNLNGEAELATPKLHPPEHISIERSQRRYVEDRYAALRPVLEKIVKNGKQTGFRLSAPRGSD